MLIRAGLLVMLIIFYSGAVSAQEDESPILNSTQAQFGGAVNPLTEADDSLDRDLDRFWLSLQDVKKASRVYCRSFVNNLQAIAEPKEREDYWEIPVTLFNVKDRVTEYERLLISKKDGEISLKGYPTLKEPVIVLSGWYKELKVHSLFKGSWFAVNGKKKDFNKVHQLAEECFDQYSKIMKGVHRENMEETPRYDFYEAIRKDRDGCIYNKAEAYRLAGNKEAADNLYQIIVRNFEKHRYDGGLEIADSARWNLEGRSGNGNEKEVTEVLRDWAFK